MSAPPREPTDEPSREPTDEPSIAAIWRGRASAEGSVHAYAQRILEDLREADAATKVLELADRMVRDEARHVGICLDVASRFAGRAVTAPAPRAIVDPLADVALPLRATLRVVATSCIGESFASAWIDESGRLTRPAWLRDVLRKHLADEVHHARLGWAHLATTRVGEAERRAVAAWLPRLVEVNLHAWRTFDPRWPIEGFPDHGLPSHALTRDVVDQALEQLVLPGFDALGVDTAAVRAWLAERGELRPS
jgi:hypothetical protein